MATEVVAQGGYRYTFTDGEASQEYQCHICTLVARDPQQVTCCGKIYCKGCLESSKKKRQKLTCPDCNKQLTGKYFEDVRAEQGIKSLEVYCTNTDSGCEWMGSIKDIDTHLNSCPYQLVPCTNGCGAMIRRIEIESHVTDDCQRSLVRCQHCQKEGSRQLMASTNHLNKCPNYPVKCNNDECEEVIPRRLQASHHMTCPKAIVPCEYSNIGCNRKMRREEKEEHSREMVQEHLQLAVRRIETLELKTTNSKVFRLTEFLQKKTQNKFWNSSDFYTSPRGYRMRLRVECSGFGDGRGRYISCYIYLVSGEYDDTLEWPFEGDVTVELLNQLEDKNHRKGVIRYNHSTPSPGKERVTRGEVSKHGWGYSKFIAHAALRHNPSQVCQYLKDDSLYFRVSVKATSKAKPWLAV